VNIPHKDRVGVQFTHSNGCLRFHALTSVQDGQKWISGTVGSGHFNVRVSVERSRYWWNMHWPSHGQVAQGMPSARDAPHQEDSAAPGDPRHVWAWQHTAMRAIPSTLISGFPG
jgi:hypothetical protein